MRHFEETKKEGQTSLEKENKNEMQNILPVYKRLV